MCGVLVPRGGVCATWVCAWRQRQRPGDPARQRTTQCVCVRGVCVCVCVCVWTAVCVCGGVCMWCVGRDTGIVSHSQAKDSTVCAPARVCMCACTRVCAWRGPGVCVLGGGGVRRCVACL